MGFHDVELTMKVMHLGIDRPHLNPQVISSKIAAQVLHDLPSGTYITKTIEELQSFIYDLQTIRKKLN